MIEILFCIVVIYELYILFPHLSILEKNVLIFKLKRIKNIAVLKNQYGKFYCKFLVAAKSFRLINRFTSEIYTEFFHHFFICFGKNYGGVHFTAF